MEGSSRIQVYIWSVRKMVIETRPW